MAALSDPERRRRILAEHADLVAGLEPGILRHIVGGVDLAFEMADPVDYELHTDRSLGAPGPGLGAGPDRDGPYDLLLERDGEQLLYPPLFNFAHGDR